MSSISTTGTSANGSTINFTGLSSGIDTASIVAELMRIEQQPIQAMKDKQTIETQRQSLLNTVKDKLSALNLASAALSNPVFWAGVPHGTTGDADSFSLDVTADAPKATYQVQVKRLATGDVIGQQATSGTHTFSETYAGAGTLASNTTPLTTLTNAAGTSLGLTAGQTISLSATQGGSALTTAAYTVTAASTLDDLKAWLQTQLPDANISIATGGRLKITSAAGNDLDILGARLQTAGPASAVFNALFAAPTTDTASSGVGKVLADDTLHLGASGITFDVPVKAGWTMRQVANAINAANGGVTAGVTDGRLRISATDTGTVNGHVSVTSTGTAATDMNLLRQVTATDGVVNVDGVDINTASNTTTSVIPGATLTLKKSMTTSATATTDPKWVDSVDAAKRASDFVAAYNDTLQTVQGMVTERKVPNAKGNDRLKGLFSNSSTLTTIEDGLRNALGGIVNGLAPGKNLSKFAGIGTAPPKGAFDAGAIDGKLTFDATAFQAMFSTDRNGLRDILGKTGATAADNGIAARVADLTAAYTAESAYTTSAGATQVVSGGGVVTAAIKGSKDLFTDIQTRIDDMTARLALREQTLKNQFLAMETAISQLKSAGAELAGKLTSLTG